MTTQPSIDTRAFDLLATLVAIVRIDGVVVFANAALEDIMGVSRRNIEGAEFSQYFAQPQAFENALKGAQTNAFAVMRYDAYLHRPLQEPLPVHVIVAPTDRAGEILIELLPLEQQTRQDREERLIDQAQANKELIRNLAHEIKNPLTPIQLSAERMAHKLVDKLDGSDADMLKRSTATIVNQVDALKRMVNEFSEYARSPAPQLQALDLNKLIQEVVSFYDLPARKLHLSLEKQAPVIKGDSTMLRHVIHNLLQNAQDALIDQSDALIQVQTKSVGPMLVLTVTDNGTGFPAEMLAHAFEPYMTTKSHGTGLGLAIVKEIASQHGAQVRVRSPLRDGRGTVIRMAWVSHG